MAFQITNIVRDFHEDLNNDRCYIPSEKFEKFGLKKKIKIKLLVIQKKFKRYCRKC